MAFIRHGKVNCLLRPGGTLLGRAGYCDVSFDDPEVSKEHALIVGTADGYFIIDLKSTNGTYVQGNEVRKTSLRDGDLIRVGATEFTFYFETAEDLEEYGELFEEVHTLEGPDGLKKSFPFAPFGMETLLRRAHLKALNRLKILYWLSSCDAEERLEMRILRLAVDTVSARRGNLRFVVQGKEYTAAVGLGGAHLPDGVLSVDEPFAGPPLPGAADHARAEPLPDRAASEKSDEARAENLTQPQEPYLFFPLPGGQGHIYLEEPSQKRHFGADDVAAVGNVLDVGLTLIRAVVASEGREAS